MNVDQACKQGVLAGFVVYQRKRSVSVDGDVIPSRH